MTSGASGYFLGVDAGSSSTKWTVLDDGGNLISEGRSRPLDGHIYRSESLNRLNEFLLEFISEAEGAINGIYAGITGASVIDTENQALQDVFLKYFPKTQISIDIDVALGYRSSFKDDRGIYIYAGTGSIAIYQDQSGQLKSLGGWGYLLGDEGAGYWIGREVLRQALFEIESNQQTSRIREVVQTQIPEVGRNAILKFTYENSREEIAKLAKPLIQLAIQGDSKACEIVSLAASHLTELALRAEKAAGLESSKIVFGGGIAQSGPILITAMEDSLQRPIEISKENLSLEAAQLALEKFIATNSKG
jgi:N-acetylglucosamine kinase-like BadF-type ATPase